MQQLILLLGVLFSFNFAHAAVWTEVNQWSPAWEDRFSEWVESDWQVDFFARKRLPNGQSNPYYGLRTDCADTVYSMRLIFAYENKLPFVIQDPTASGRTISNKMNRWDRQNELARLKNFLIYIYNMTSTKSLPNDTYPVAISRNSVRAGSLILTTAVNHHSWTIKEMLAIGVPHLVYNSTIGATSSAMLQERQSWPNPEWVFEGDATPTGNAGFRYWRPAEYLNQPAWKVPGYSEEQYKVPLKRWVKYSQGRLALRRETDEQLMARLMKVTCQGLQGRVSAVNDGLNALRSTRKCMPFAAYDTYSTPSRDQRIFDDYVTLRKTYRDLVVANNAAELSLDMRVRLNKIFPFIQETMAAETRKMAPTGVDGTAVCTTEYLSGQYIDLAEFKRRLFAGLISNNPMDEVQYRWGQLRGPSQRARSCQSWDVWVPNLKQD
ncbi:hypothetical protein [Bdellovibrio sp. HCB274]|uniref:hypothetical protein n=1 Tax=Bdellovibrio sp. HCB274 TaxID=3394361 RepID=UPI0039B67FC9